MRRESFRMHIAIAAALVVFAGLLMRWSARTSVANACGSDGPEASSYVSRQPTLHGGATTSTDTYFDAQSDWDGQPGSLDAYLHGEIGLVRPGFAPSFLVVAFRHLDGVGLSPEEVAGARAVLLERLRVPTTWSGPPREPDSRYLAIRSRVLSTPFPDITNGRWGDHYTWEPTCLSDAFKSAAENLGARIDRFGASSREARAFAEGQDVVFRACDGQTELPFSELGPASSVVRDDRRYHEAAQAFYLERFDAARARFETIAEDRASAYHDVAHLVLARIHVRRADALESDAAHDSERARAYADAVAVLDHVLADEALASIHRAARAYRRYAKRRGGDSSDFVRLAPLLTETRMGAELEGAFRDLLFLNDVVETGLATTASANVRPFAGTRFETFSKLLSRNLDAPPTEMFAQSMRAYGERESPAFLVTTLALVDSEVLATVPSATIDGLVTAAERIPPAHPAYVSVRFHLARIRLARGGDSAESVFAELVPIRQRLRAGHDTGTSHAFDELAFYAATNVGELAETMGDASYFHNAARQLFLRRLGVVDRLALSELSSLSETTRNELVRMTFTRALLLDEPALVRALVPRLRVLDPASSELVSTWVSANTRIARRRARLELLLESASIRVYPSTSYGYGGYGVGSRDDYAQGPESSLLAGAYRGSAARIARIVGPERIARGDAESARIATLGAMQTLLAREVVAIAENAPDRERDPSRLARVVRSSRNGCSDDDSLAATRRAFELLHRLYPNHAETRATRYYHRGPSC